LTTGFCVSEGASVNASRAAGIGAMVFSMQAASTLGHDR